MEFRLVYSGSLPAAGRSTTRNETKIEIRRTLSKQLRELWATHPRMRRRLEKRPWVNHWGENPDPARELWSYVEMHALRFQVAGRNYCPVISNDSGAACELNILFLRRDQPGNLIASGGDIDNRLKVLFDALRMPQNADEVGDRHADDDAPHFCLLEDDSLITDVRITTDRLLTPIGVGEHLHDVHLVIHVRTALITSINSAHMWLT